MAKIQVSGYQCERCKHVWMPRSGSVTEPKVCPKCKSPYWDRPRMKEEQISTVNLYQMFGVKKLRYRESAEEIVENLPKGDSLVVIDFANIEFASPSFLQGLLAGISSRKVTFENTPEFVHALIEKIQAHATAVSV